jgi:DNA processing protein
VRLARVGLSCLVEPGNHVVYELVTSDGPEAALRRMADGDVPSEDLRGAVAARLRGGDPFAIAADALSHAARLGARVAIPEDDE